MSAGVPAAEGVPPVTAEDVAEVIESVVRKPKAEVWVPGWVQIRTKVVQAAGRRNLAPGPLVGPPCASRSRSPSGPP